MGAAPKSRLRIILEQALLIAIVAAIFYLIFRRVKIHDVLLALRTVEPVRFFILSFLFVAATLLIDACTHFALFKRFNFNFSFSEMLQLRLANLLFASLGFIYGQGGMAWMASRDSKKPAAQVVGLLAFLFFNTFHAALFWITLGMIFFLPALNAAKTFSWLWIWIAIDWPLFIAWVWFWQSRFKNLVPARLRESLLYGFDRARPARYLEMGSLRALQFLVIAFFIRLALPGMLIDIPFRAVVSILPIQGILIAIPTPGRYGVNEGAFLLLFRNWAEESRLVAFGLLWGTCSNVLRSLASLIALQKLRGK